MNITQSAELRKSIFSSRFYPWFVWGLAAVFFYSEYVARVAPSVMIPLLMRDFHVGALALGSLSAFFYYAYVGMQIPVGLLVDRYGPHRLLTVATGLFGLGCFSFGTAHSVPLAELGRFLMGFTGAFAFVGSLKLAAVWFSPARFGLLAGLTQALGMLGAATGEAPTSFLVSGVGWRGTMIIMGVFFFSLAALIGLFVRDKPTGDMVVKSPSDNGFSEVLAGLAVVVRDPQSWYNALFAGLLYAPTAVFAELWGTQFLVQTYQLDTHLAATGISLIFIGWAMGGPLMGWWSDKIQRRRSLMIYSTVATFVILSVVLYVPFLPLWVLFSMLFLYGVVNTGIIPAYAVATEIVPRQIAGTSLAFINMASVLVGAILQPVVGWFLDKGWDGKIVDGAPVYSSEAYHSAVYLLPLSLLLALVLAILVKETYCKPHRDSH